MKSGASALPKVACIILFAAASCSDNKDRHAARVLSAIEARYGCPETAERIPSASVDSLSKDERCALVAAGLDALASATPASGLDNSDLALVERADLIAITIVDPLGEKKQSYWSIELSLRGRPYNAEVQVDQSTGNVKARRVHKPIY